MGQGLAAIAENIKKRKEAEEAASGKTPPPVAGLKAAAPKPAPPKAPVKSTSELAGAVDKVMAGTVDETDAVIAKQREAMKKK